MKKGNTFLGGCYKGNQYIGELYKGSQHVNSFGFPKTVSGASPITLPTARAKALSKNEVKSNTVRTISIDGVEYVVPAATLHEYVQNGLSTMVDTGVNCSDNMEFYIRFKCGTLNSLYLLQRRSSSAQNINGITGKQTGGKIALGFGGISVVSSITRTVGNVYTVKGIILNGNMTLYVKDETNGTEDTQTGTYTVGTIPTDNVTMFGNTKGDNLDSGTKVYAAYIKKNGTMAWCIVGNYDLIGNATITATRGTLTAGAELPTPECPLGVKGVGEKTEQLINNDDCQIIISEVATVNRAGWLLSLPAGETYTVSIDSDRAYVRIKEGDSSWTNYETITPTSSYTFTSTESFKIHIYGTGTSTVEQMKSKHIQLVKGSTAPTEYIPYGYKVTERVSGANLFNPDNADTRYNGWWSNGGVVANSPGTNRTIIIPCSEGNVFTFKHYTEASGARYFWIYSDTVAVGEPCSSAYGDVIGTGPKTTTAAPSNAKYIGICFWRTTAGTVQSAADDFVIVKGSTAPTTYEPYFEPTTYTAYIDKPLGKVGTYADTFDFASGVHTEGVGVKVLDGTEEWQVGQSYTDGTYRTFLSMSFPSVDSAILCSHFEQGQFSDRNQANQGNKLYINTTSIQIRSTQFDSPVSAKSWLAAQYAAGTPVTVWYPLATPVTTQHTAVPVTLAKGTNYLESTNEIKGDLEATYKSREA